MADTQKQISFHDYLVDLVQQLELMGYHHAKAGSHQGQLYSQVVQEITILEKK